MNRNHRTIASLAFAILLVVAGPMSAEPTHADIIVEAETLPAAQMIAVAGGEPFAGDLIPPNSATARLNDSGTVLLEVHFVWNEPFLIFDSVFHEGQWVFFWTYVTEFDFRLVSPLPLPSSATSEIEWGIEGVFVNINGTIAPVFSSADRDTFVTVSAVQDGPFDVSFDSAGFLFGRMDQGTGMTVRANVTVHDMGGVLFPLTIPCPWDCAEPPDDEVSVVDFLAMLAQWGQVETSCDFDGGGVDFTDFLEMIGNWGPCE
jgi:hypothetical protein